MEDIPLLHHVRGDKKKRLSQNGESSYRKDTSGKVLVSVDKTPTHLTPSQRLQMRKQRLNDRITQFQFKTANESSTELSLDSDDEDIDESEDIFNVPISSQLDWRTNLPKHTFTSDTGLSSASESARSSSIFSSVSDDLTCTSSIYDSRLSLVSDEKRPHFGTNLSNDAFELSMRFGADGKCRIMQEARERRRLLSLFLKVGNSYPPGAHELSNCHIPQHEVKPDSYILKYFLSTRPSWLPPKSLYDKIKHQKESEEIIYLALSRQSTVVSKKLEDLQELDKLKAADIECWNSMTEADIKSLKQSIKGRKMYWRGVPNFKKAFVWSTLLQSETKILNDLCTSYFLKSSELIDPESQNENKNTLPLFQLSETIDMDLLRVFPEQRLFQESAVMCDLKGAIVAFLIYSKDTTASTFEEGDGSQAFISRTYFSGIAQLSSLLYAIYKDKFMVFRTLCVLFSEDKLLGSIMRWRQYKSSSKGENLSNLIQHNYFDDFLLRLEAICPSLSSHLKSRGITEFDYAPLALMSIMSDYFNFDLSMQILSIWIFERDSFLVTSLLSMLKLVAHKLFGSKKEILSLLAGGQATETPKIKFQSFTNLVDTHDFIYLVDELMSK